jgi:hypothetical protein
MGADFAKFWELPNEGFENSPNEGLFLFLFLFLL